MQVAKQNITKRIVKKTFPSSHEIEKHFAACSDYDIIPHSFNARSSGQTDFDIKTCVQFWLLVFYGYKLLAQANPHVSLGFSCFVFHVTVKLRLHVHLGVSQNEKRPNTLFLAGLEKEKTIFASRFCSLNCVA